MLNVIKTLAVTAALTVAASTASAITTDPFDTPLNPGDSTSGFAMAAPFEDYGMTSLSFSAADDLTAEVSFTINPFLTDLSGTPANAISLASSINGGILTALAINTVDIGVGSIGAGGEVFTLAAGDVLEFFISGVAGQEGNRVDFTVEASPLAPVPVAPAGALLLTSLAGFAAMRRKAKQ